MATKPPKANAAKKPKRKARAVRPTTEPAGLPLAPAIAQNPELLARVLADRAAAHARDAALLAGIKAALPELDAMHAVSIRSLGDYEDGLYRFYHHSFKVYELQPRTEAIVALLERLAPEGAALNPWFRQIVTEGTGKVWKQAHNAEWLTHTRPIVEAYLHARYFFQMVRKYGRELEAAPQVLPSGWAAVLELYGIQ